MAFVTLSGEEAEISALVDLFIRSFIFYSSFLLLCAVTLQCGYVSSWRGAFGLAFYTLLLAEKVSQIFRITLSSLFYSSLGVLMAGTVSITQTAGYIMALKVSEWLSLIAVFCHTEIAQQPSPTATSSETVLTLHLTHAPSVRHSGNVPIADRAMRSGLHRVFGQLK